mmetsp:Transcript_84661/g.220389  ORF Transcript_84661/g.220389 Transcript_84661/m.220389 type:complete len:208 (+) Transcript_84661:841-1464(+)
MVRLDLPTDAEEAQGIWVCITHRGRGAEASLLPVLAEIAHLVLLLLQGLSTVDLLDDAHDLRPQLPLAVVGHVIPGLSGPLQHQLRLRLGRGLARGRHSGGPHTSSCSSILGVARGTHGALRWAGPAGAADSALLLRLGAIPPQRQRGLDIPGHNAATLCVPQRPVQGSLRLLPNLLGLLLAVFHPSPQPRRRVVGPRRRRRHGLRR